jgi:nucleoside-diphosphate-sugar epimerase
LHGLKQENGHDLGPVSLVTGAGGFIGSHLVDRLLFEGHRVIGIDNLCTGNLNNLQNALSDKDRAFFIEADVTESFELPDLPVNFIWHLASPASPLDYRRLSIETMLVNSVGSKRLLDIAVKHNAKFLLASTSEAYGDPLAHPQTETYWGNVNPIGERACYDESKRFAEALTLEYCRRYGLDARVIRIFNTYGPRMQITDGRVVPNFINQALRGEPLTVYGDGSQTRSFVYVKDEVEGILRAMFCEHTKGEVINLGNPEEYSILEFAEIVARLCGVEMSVVYKPLPADDPTRRCPDINKARNLLGWEPSTPLEQGLSATIDYFISQIKAPWL